MVRRMNALIWSRFQMILANKMVSVNLFMPILMVILYQYMFKGQDGMKDMILFMVLPMIPAMTGYLLPIVVGEEAEKNNQRSLQLAGVKNWEYVVASLIIPFLVNLFYLFALPLYLGMDLVELGWQYIPVMLVTSLTWPTRLPKVWRRVPAMPRHQRGLVIRLMMLASVGRGARSGRF